jgi:outer membrane protein TolC
MAVPPRLPQRPLIRPVARALTAVVTTLSLGGCVGFTPDGGMSPVIEVAASRLDKDVIKIRSDVDAGSAQDQTAKLLAHPLTAGRAVQVAFLRNRDLQASFNELGVSEAEYVKASLPPEPSFSLNQLAGMGDVEVVSQVAVGLFALATLPARQEIASEKFQAAQWRTAGEVMALAADVSRQYFMTVAAQDQDTFLGTAVSGAQASADLARQLGEAGNINKLQQAREGSLCVELGAQLADARLQAKAERERLTRLMGLWGHDIAFKLPKSLPALPKRIMTERDVEATALRQRLDLRAARHELDALARQLGLTNATRYVTDVSLAFQNDTERAASSSNGSNLTRNGAVLDFTIPIYDFGESKVRNAHETYMAAANRLAQRAINARSQAREAYVRYRGKYDLARYYQERVVPLQTTIFEQSSLETNGMLADVTQLILDARLRSTNNVAAIVAKRDFFLAAVDLKAALTGNGLSSSGSATRAPVTGVIQASN